MNLGRVKRMFRKCRRNSSLSPSFIYGEEIIGIRAFRQNILLILWPVQNFQFLQNFLMSQVYIKRGQIHTASTNQTNQMKPDFISHCRPHHGVT